MAPDIKCTGSTDKGTALPEKYFAIDFDGSVSANDDLIDLIAYRSNVFEGCQLFNLDFLCKFAEEFENLYFAGHRISGEFKDRRFDFSITDMKKDKWKWDFNSSKILKYIPNELNEVKKTKFFLKTFNVYGSEVYGIVGPAVELGIHYHHNFGTLKQFFAEFECIKSDMGSQFKSIPFPKEFYDIFPESNDSVHVGLINSFRYTMPNTYNRLIRATRCKELNHLELIKKDDLEFIIDTKTTNERLIAYFFSIAFEDNEYFPLDYFYRNGKMSFYSYGTRCQKKLLKKAVNEINSISSQREFRYSQLPEVIKNDLQKKLSQTNLENYSFFIGIPNFPLDKSKTYIPFDFLIRADAEKLICVMEEGQHDFE